MPSSEWHSRCDQNTFPMTALCIGRRSLGGHLHHEVTSLFVLVVRETCGEGRLGHWNAPGDPPRYDRIGGKQRLVQPPQTCTARGFSPRRTVEICSFDEPHIKLETLEIKGIHIEPGVSRCRCFILGAVRPDSLDSQLTQASSSSTGVHKHFSLPRTLHHLKNGVSRVSSIVPTILNLCSEDRRPSWCFHSPQLLDMASLSCALCGYYVIAKRKKANDPEPKRALLRCVYLFLFRPLPKLLSPSPESYAAAIPLINVVLRASANSSRRTLAFQL